MPSRIVPWNSRKKLLPVGKDEQSAAALPRHVNRLFNEFLHSSIVPEFFSEPLAQFGERWGSFMPAVNVTKRERELIVTVEVPGMDERDIEISLTKEGLIIRGERKPQHQESGEQAWCYVESIYGAFERIVPLSDLQVEEDGVEATSSKGLVVITIPVKERAASSAKKVEIRPS